jgi:hypothetical protein
MQPNNNNTVQPVTRHMRRGALSSVLWAFGLATTLLLVGLWGRAVTADQETLARSTGEVLSADVVTQRVYDWIGDGIAAAAGIPVDDVQPAVEAVRSSPEANRAISALVEDTVAVFMAPPGSEASVDIVGALGPLVPRIAAELAERGVGVSENSVTAALANLDAVEIDTGEVGNVMVVADEARGVITVGVMLAFVVLVAAGSLAVALSDDRMAMVRSLGTRLSFSALSFAALFRFGGWILDPDGGRSPIMRGGATVIGSNLHVFLFVAAVGAAMAGVAGAVWWISALRAGPQPPADAEEDDPTRELVAV